MISFWEKESFVSYDYIIVGGGIVGFSTAISLRERNPKATILVLEAGFLPSGASTKNAGFACIGSLSELIEDLKHQTEEEVRNLVQLRYDGLQLLRNRLGDASIEYCEEGSHEIVQENELYLMDQLDHINLALTPIFKEDVFSDNSKQLANFGFGSSAKHLIKNNFEGSIHTGKMMKQLILKAESLGIEYKTNAKVSAVNDSGKEVQVTIESLSLPLKANKVCICTNAFAKQLVPEINLSPGRGQVLITKETSHLPFKGIFHFDEGYYYFRNYKNRVLFGGGRNIDFEKETSTKFDLNHSIQASLEEKLRTLIYPKGKLEVEMRWTGIMAFGKTKQPLLKKVSPNIFAGVRLGGMGVAIGSKLGELLASHCDADEHSL